ncbi:MAG TPA: filamentous hemagglutinin N-terminal domain-containing protein [Chroococcales cyanobacterium]
MTQSWRSRCRKLGLVSSFSVVGVATISPVQAQVRSDGTLGTNVTCTTTCTITGGTTTQGNLFHSFRDFSVPEQGAAIFDNATTIQNIFNRVTGKATSNINGLISANGTANVFILNPNGILFGPNAQLNIGGSFVATTANAIEFSDRGTFIASTAQTDVSLLAVNPSAFLFNQLAAQTITNQSVAQPLNSSIVDGEGLRVPDGKSLLLIGGNVTLDGGGLRAPGGRVELGGMAGTGRVGLIVNGNTMSLSFPPTGLADVSLSNGAEVNVAVGGGGTIAINAQNLNLTQASQLQAGIASDLGSANSKAGDIVINATQEVTQSGGSFIANSVQPKAVGQAGNVTINADTVSMDGESSNPDSPYSGAYSRLEEGAVGQGGSIEIGARSLSLTNGAVITTSIDGTGNAGSVIINAETVSFDGQGSLNPTGAFSTVKENGIGQAGSVNVTARSLTLTQGAALISSTLGQGNAGNVTIKADTVSFDGEGSNSLFPFSGAYSRVEEGAVGQGGSIEIETGFISLTNGAVVTTSIDGMGNAGSVMIKADTVSFDGQGRLNPTGAFSAVKENGIGQGGSVNVTARSLLLTHGAGLITSTLGQGNAGNVTINAETISFDGEGSNSLFPSSGAYSRVEEGAVGQGGRIEIGTQSLSLTQGAVVNTSTLGQGNAGRMLESMPALPRDTSPSELYVRLSLHTALSRYLLFLFGNFELHELLRG